MEVHRIEGIKYNFDRLTTEELQNIRGHLLAQHQQVTDEIELIDGVLFDRQHDQLDFHTGPENYERMLGHAVMSGEITAPEALDALSRYAAET